MKKTVFLTLILLVSICAEGFSQKKKDRHKVNTDTVTADSTEYELIIFDPGFEIWLIIQPSKEFYTQGYYEQMNRLYVSEWNFRYLASRYNGEYDSYIDYDINIDYGLELNYKLYYYFKYFEEKNRIILYQTLR